jgi:DNA helicase-2/ATP-dependent DNA helicase PcrA
VSQLLTRFSHVQAHEFNASIRSLGVESKVSEPTGDPVPAKWIAGLNPQQASAVAAPPQGALLILAGAGSGKTTVLTRRIAHLLERFPNDGILALTFTKDAALEMEGRLRGLLGQLGERAAGIRPPWIGTFHSFAFGLIRSGYQGIPNWSRLGFSRCPSLLEPAERTAWLAAEKKNSGIEAPLEMLEVCISNPFGGSPGESSGEFLAGPLPAPEAGLLSEDRERLRERFRAHLKQSGSVAFDDMVSLAIRLLSEHADVLADLHVRHPRILVDEFQDTSRDQLNLVKLLCGGTPSLFLVGDDDQAIYGFRGADPGNIGDALAHFPGLRILKLEINYRSSAAIVAYANAVFRDKPAPLRKRLEAGRSRAAGAAEAPVRRIVHANGAEQGRWMVGEMQRLRREAGLAWSGMAVLFRLNALEPYYRSMLAKLAGAEAAREVVLSTVHAAKGLEYPAVFFAGLEDGILPYRRGGAKLPPEREAEELRIFYVGVTRAQRFLYLCSCRTRILRGKSVSAAASPFLRAVKPDPPPAGILAAAALVPLIRKAGRLFGSFRIGLRPVRRSSGCHAVQSTQSKAAT